MISHKYQCIFVHIPRIAGTSLEFWICGENWWKIEKETKHLIASQAKEKYREYWDDYLKFSFVRNPWDRMVSCRKFDTFYGVYFRRCWRTFYAKRMSFRDYRRLFGPEIVLEHDHRFYRREDLLSDHHLPGQVYGNILDEPLDFIGRFENFDEDCRKLQKILGIPEEMNVHAVKSERKAYHEYYHPSTREEVGRLYANDIKRFGYQF
ncbi:MAG: sulfotransferase family 2 domain-containing protein [Puniceicoccales bacterium]